MHSLELAKYDGTEGTVTIATEDFESLCGYYKHWYSQLPAYAHKLPYNGRFRFWVNASLDVCSRGGEDLA